MDQGMLDEEFTKFVSENYENDLLENIRLKKESLTIDFSSLAKFSFDLANTLLDDPEGTIKSFELALLTGFDGINSKILVRVKNLPKSEIVQIRNIRSKHTNKLFVIEGNVKNRSPVKPQATSAKFECPSCGNIISLLQIDNNFKEPTACSCGRKGKFILLSSEKMDVQYVSVEEPFDQLDEDSVPQRIGVLLQKDITDPIHQKNYIPGKPIRITGILKEIPLFVKGKKQINMDYLFEAIHCESLEDDITKTTFTEEEIAEFKTLSKDKDFDRKIIASVAPHICGHNKVKEAMILYLVKGVSKESKDGKKTREYFNMLLMGDPGAAKSQLGNEINLLSWRSRKVVGKGASGPGLTASAEKDELLNMRVLSAGAIPLCNEGHVVIDEVDKMEKDVQSHLHEAMEDGSITINKSQIQGQLKARTAVFMIGNPKYGRYDYYMPIIEQIELPKALINRFDLIFPIKDIPNKAKDKKLAQTILNKHMDIDEATKRVIPLQMLKNYICYTSLNIKPKLTKKAYALLEDFFLELRDDEGKKSIGITGRQLDGLVRMAEASAKLHMRNKVTEKDAQKAIELLSYSLMAFATDPKTGKLDVDRMTTGISASERSDISRIKEIIKTLEDGKRHASIMVDDIIIEAKNAGIDETQTQKMIDKLRRAGDIFEPKRGYISRND